MPTILHTVVMDGNSISTYLDCMFRTIKRFDRRCGNYVEERTHLGEGNKMPPIFHVFPKNLCRILLKS
jgi:hypothetical protein